MTDHYITGPEFEYDDQPDRPVLGRSGEIVGVALPESVQPRAILSAVQAVRLGRELVRLGEALIVHAEQSGGDPS